MKVKLTERIDAYNWGRNRGEPPMTQARLAKALGVTQSAVSLWANGKRPMTVPVALRVAVLLNCRLDDLFSLADDSQAVIEAAGDA